MLCFAAAPSAFIKDLEDITLNECGLDAPFFCEVSNIQLKPEWFKLGKPIKSSDKYEMISKDGQHTLIIKGCQSDDVAQYSIKLNGLQSAAKLDIKGKY